MTWKKHSWKGFISFCWEWVVFNILFIISATSSTNLITNYNTFTFWHFIYNSLAILHFMNKNPPKTFLGKLLLENLAPTVKQALFYKLNFFFFQGYRCFRLHAFQRQNFKRWSLERSVADQVQVRPGRCGLRWRGWHWWQLGRFRQNFNVEHDDHHHRPGRFVHISAVFLHHFEKKQKS